MNQSMNVIIDVALPFTKRMEGFRAKPYKDDRGNWAIGYGFSPERFDNERELMEAFHEVLDEEWDGKTFEVSEADAARMCRLQLEEAYEDLDLGAELDAAPDSYRAALTDFAFNAGPVAAIKSEFCSLYRRSGMDGFKASYPSILARTKMSDGERRRREGEYKLAVGTPV